MTREEAIKIFNTVLFFGKCDCQKGEIEECFKIAIKALEQDRLYYDFARWVATEIFGEMWEYNKDAFEELACRKLEKLGIVRAKGDEWQLIETQESEVSE